MAITAIPLSEHIGAEVRGVDLTKPLDEATRAEIYRLWLKHLILLFRGQELSQEQLIQATQVFGEQAIANPLHAGPMRGIRAGVDREIALRIDTHGAAREVRRTDPHEPIVDDHHPRMDERADVASA